MSFERGNVPISLMVLAAFVPNRLAGRTVVPSGILITKLPRFVPAGIFSKADLICANEVPTGQVIVPTVPSIVGTQVQGDIMVLLILQLGGGGVVVGGGTGVGFTITLI